MRLAWLMCSCVLVVACDRGPVSPSRPTQPVAPSGTMQPITAPVAEPITAAPVAEPTIRETPTARAEAEPIVEARTVPPEREPELEPEPASSQVTGDCCKTCHKGKACGDTCVARDRECTVAPGCACDAE